MKNTTKDLKSSEPETKPVDNRTRFKLTEDETSNLLGREKFADYVLDLIKKDLALYLSEVIYQRLDIKPDQKPEVSADRQWILVSPKIIIPGGKK